MSTWFSRIRFLLQRRRLDADLREEIESHRAMRQSALEANGMTPDAEASASRRALGNVALAMEDARDVWAIRTVESAWQDVRAAARGLRKSPSFAVIAIGTLALGIGANTALFSIFNSLVLRPLPVHDPGRLVLLDNGPWTYPIWDEVQRLDRDVVAGTIAWSDQTFDLSDGGETRLVDGALVSGRYFDVLGVPAARGRVLASRDDVRGTNDFVAVISHRFWQEHFGGADDVVGRTVTLQRVPFTVVGVLPAEFFGTVVGRRTDLFVPLALHPFVHSEAMAWFDAPSSWWLDVMMRLEPGQSLEQATTAARALQPQIRAATMPDWSEEMRARYLDEPFTLVPATTGKSALRGHRPAADFVHI